VTTATMITAPETAVAGPTVAEVMAAADTATVGKVIDLSFERGNARSSGPRGPAYACLMSTSSIRSGWPSTVASTMSPNPAT
jgi:hypothetical protein